MDSLRPALDLVVSVLAIMAVIILVKLGVNYLPDNAVTTPIKQVVNIV